MVDVLEPHGFCLGVKHALARAREALRAHVPVYGLHEIVHNAGVVDELRAAGMVFVEALDAVPAGGTVLFSAHGVSPSVRAEAARRQLRVIDATCPFVTRAHRAVSEFAQRGLAVVVIGHAAHVEVAGLVGEAEAVPGARVAVVSAPADVAALPFPRETPVGVVCQTTLAGETVQTALAALRARFGHVETTSASDSCTATRDRQQAVRAWAAAHPGGVVVVLGDARSSNTRRLAEVAEASGARALRVASPAELPAHAADFNTAPVALTAGASTPESVVAAARRFFETMSGNRKESARDPERGV